MVSTIDHTAARCGSRWIPTKSTSCIMTCSISLSLTPSCITTTASTIRSMTTVTPRGSRSDWITEGREYHSSSYFSITVGEDGADDGEVDVKSAVWICSILSTQSVADVLRLGRLRWFGHLEHRSVDDWVSACRNVEVAGVRCRG